MEQIETELNEFETDLEQDVTNLSRKHTNYFFCSTVSILFTNLLKFSKNSK